ncbi:MAG: two-component system, NarL family, nitrate/nitrite response regulator NarL [Actinomycetota bacterium]|jgi:signal transduction histidine kinase
MAMPNAAAAPLIRILIVDDHAMFAESVARLMDREPDIQVIGVAADSRSGVALARTEQPDVAIVDYGLPDADGTQTAADIRAVSPATNVLLLTGLPDDGVATVAIQAGCSGFLTKDKAGHELVSATRVVASGQAFIPPSHLADLHRGLATQRIRSEFLSRVGHEFRTPLTAILGYGRLIAARPISTDRALELGAHIVRSGERLQRIVEILEFTETSERGELVLQQQPCKPEALIGSAIKRLTERLDVTRQLVVNASPSLPSVYADPHWFAVAIDELIDNAIKFSPDGDVVTIDAVVADLEGTAAVEISVTDHGIGMTPSAREVAFENYMQFDSSDTRAFGGLGLGLSLVRGVALAHGGRAACVPAVPAGTRVSIVIAALGGA